MDFQLRGFELYTGLGSSPSAGSNSTSLQRLKFLSFIQVDVRHFPLYCHVSHMYQLLICISDDTVSTKRIHLLILIQRKGVLETLMVAHLVSINSFHEEL